MFKPVNTSLEEFFKRKFNRDVITTDNAVSVITCTNQDHSLSNILDNFNRQDYPRKELIIVINNNDEIDIEKWKKDVISYDNITIYKIPGKISLGECLNFAVKKSQYGIVAKFDDDDYYGPKYLSEICQYFKSTRAKLIGKGSTFVYLVNKQMLTIRNPQEENRYTDFVNGSTLVFKKEIFNKVSFRNITVGEDIAFCEDCVRNGIYIYSCSRYNHVYIRYPSAKQHTWIINDDDLVKLCCRPDILNQTVDDIKNLKLYVDR